MQAYMNEESLRLTLNTGMAWYWSRSRKRLWNKGETSGHVQRVLEIRADCDGDSLLLLVDQTGSACHTGVGSCYYTRVPESGPGEKCSMEYGIHWPPDGSGAVAGASGGGVRLGRALDSIFGVISDRKADPCPDSYTNKLLAGAPDSYCKKIGEEATEVVLAIKNRDASNLSFEAADLLYHTLVALVDSGVALDAVASELERRQGRRREGGPR